MTRTSRLESSAGSLLPWRGAAADSFASGSITSISVGGNILASVLAAGLQSGDAVFDANDSVTGTAATIAKLIVRSAASPDTLFAAGTFRSVRIGNLAVNPATDSRFLTTTS